MGRSVPLRRTAIKRDGADRDEDLSAFHCHLGPYIVLGYRIGRDAKERFCPDPFLMMARETF